MIANQRALGHLYPQCLEEEEGGEGNAEQLCGPQGLPGLCSMMRSSAHMNMSPPLIPQGCPEFQRYWLQCVVPRRSTKRGWGGDQPWGRGQDLGPESPAEGFVLCLGLSVADL